MLMEKNKAQIPLPNKTPNPLGQPKPTVPESKIKRKIAFIVSFAVLTALILIFLGTFGYQKYISSKYPTPADFLECSKIPGSIVQESYPATCITKKGERFIQELRPNEICISVGGVWIENYNECEGIEENVCTKAGGSFESCASPCRHTPKVKACIDLCIKVCKF